VDGVPVPFESGSYNISPAFLDTLPTGQTAGPNPAALPRRADSGSYSNATGNSNSIG